MDGLSAISAARTEPCSTAPESPPERLLKPGDRITAGHLDSDIRQPRFTAPQTSRSFRFHARQHAPGSDDTPVSSSTTITRLEGVIGNGNRTEPSETLAANHVSALIRAGNELAGNRPLPELFRFILDLSIQAVQGRSRGSDDPRRRRTCRSGKPGRRLPDQRGRTRPRAE